MVESLRELNRLCQKPRYKEVGNWMVRHVLRDVALPITWLLLHTPVTANQVTTLSFLIGLAGIALFVLPTPIFFLLGTILLQLWYLLDHVDGQIARYRGTASLTGRFFDFLTHHTIHGVIFFSLGMYGFRTSRHALFIVWGFVTSISMMLFNLIHDTKYKTFFEKLITLKAVKVKGRGEGKESRPSGRVRLTFSFLHKICEIHVLMNILTLAAFFQTLTRLPLDLRFLFYCLYGIVVPVIAVTKITCLILNREIDREFEAQFKVLNE